MCCYDDMTVIPVSHLSHQIVRTTMKGTTDNSPVKLFNNLKKFIKNILNPAKFWLIIYLLISPVSGGPLIRHSRSSRQASNIVPFRHSQSDHPKVGIGSDQLPHESSLSQQLSSSAVVSRRQPHFSNSFNTLHSSEESLAPVKSFSNLNKSPVKLIHTLIKILSSLKDSSSDPLSSQVPKLSGSDSASIGVPTVRTNHRIISSAYRTPVIQTFSPISNMDETDDVGGRQRRATSSTPSVSGGGHWMKPCPNLDSKLDDTATPQSLSALIVRAIHEANSQVDKFINDFAREAFQANSWIESLPDLIPFTLPFLNNSSGMDLSSSTAISFPLALQEAYELMQRRAVGIEQVTLDQALYQASFLTEFRHVEDRIVHVLCELRYAMIQSGVTPKEDVTKDVMEEKARDMDGERDRNIRDAVILREYVTGLKDLHALFNNYASSSQ